MYTIHALQRQMEDMHIKRDDTVLFHTSMKAIGEVEGRADGFLDAMMEYLSAGLLAFPTLTWELAYEPSPVFDVANTPSVVGLLPELMRKRPGVVRSWHPTHSMCAFGEDARAFTMSDHLNATPCGLRSTWRKLIDRNAKILLVGCTLTSCTFLHGVEEWAGVEGRLDPPVTYTIVPPEGEGEPFRMSSQPHHGSPSEQFWRMEKELEEKNALRFGTLGNAKVYVLDARKTCQITMERLRAQPRLFDEA